MSRRTSPDPYQEIIASAKFLGEFFTKNQAILPFKGTSENFAAWFKQVSNIDDLKRMNPSAGMTQLELIRAALKISKTLIVLPVHQKCVDERLPWACKRMYEYTEALSMFSENVKAHCLEWYRNEDDNKRSNTKEACREAWETMFQEAQNAVEGTITQLRSITGRARIEALERLKQDNTGAFRGVNKEFSVALDVSNTAYQELNQMVRELSATNTNLAQTFMRDLQTLDAGTQEKIQQLTQSNSDLLAELHGMRGNMDSRFQQMQTAQSQLAEQNQAFTQTLAQQDAQIRQFIAGELLATSSRIEEVSRESEAARDVLRQNNEALFSSFTAEQKAVVENLTRQWQTLQRQQEGLQTQWKQDLEQFTDRLIQDNQTFQNSIHQQISMMFQEQQRLTKQMGQLTSGQEFHRQLKALEGKMQSMPSVENMHGVSQQIQNLQALVDQQKSSYVQQRRDTLQQLTQVNGTVQALQQKYDDLTERLADIQQGIAQDKSTPVQNTQELTQLKATLQQLQKEMKQQLKQKFALTEKSAAQASPAFGGVEQESTQDEILNLMMQQTQAQSQREFQSLGSRLSKLQSRLDQLIAQQVDQEAETRKRILALENWKHKFQTMLFIFVAFFGLSIILAMFTSTGENPVPLT